MGTGESPLWVQGTTNKFTMVQDIMDEGYTERCRRCTRQEALALL